MILIFYSLLFLAPSCTAIDSIFPNQALKDNGNTLISASESFELGFFSPPNTKNRYVAIWFKKILQKTPIWVANKNKPIRDSSGVLTITPSGNILITSNKTILWDSNSSSISATNPVLKLLENGNLVVKTDNENTESFLWQSFDHPCDTLVPGMKLGWNLRTNQEWYLTSWKSLDDPSRGDYTYRLDPRGLGQIVFRIGSKVMFRSGPWIGDGFSGGPSWNQNSVFNPIFVFNSSFAYYAFENIGVGAFSRFVVNQSGLIDHLSWNERSNMWINVLTFQVDSCESYATCGPYGICNIQSSPICHCLEGYVPKSPQDWNRLDWSGGCVEKVALNCSTPREFIELPGVKLPDSKRFVVNVDTSEIKCSENCLRNCSCVAYAETRTSGCVIWFGDLVDIREYSERGQDLYIKIDSSEIGSHNNKRTVVIALLVPLAVVVLILSLFTTRYIIRGRNCLRKEALAAQLVDNRRVSSLGNNSGIIDEDLELPLFDLPTISTATNNFSFSNKLGEGGFGPVYKGSFSNGIEIAVKRLSKTSGQGLEEFKNEVAFISRLQHRNLVRILGCCVHKEERMLIYEYMPNRSLDLFIFNQTRGTSLDWKKRINIVSGVARGLLYLHRDSSLRIIHRDLKASNILLDSELNPKISDFGLAKTLGVNQFEENTKRVFGTYGYMSPEYAIDGHFSVKSDVFSFGVLVLEIISGRKNKGFCHPDHELNLLGHAWTLWNEGDPMRLVDPSMEIPFSELEVVKLIHVALLCVQHRPDDRPAMSEVVLILDSEDPMMPMPKQPGFYAERYLSDTESSSLAKNPSTSNNYYASFDETITTVHGR